MIEKTCKGQVGMMGHGKVRKEEFRVWAWRVTPKVLTRLTSIAEPKKDYERIPLSDRDPGSQG